MSNKAVYPSLNNKVVVITGGGSGIGEAITRSFLKQGAKVSFLDFNENHSKNLIKELDTDKVHFELCDLRDIEQLKNSIKNVSSKFGPIQILINNAARDDRHSLESVTSEYFDERIATNLKHQLFASQAVVNDMESNGGGVIINMGSTSWMIGQGGMPCYTTAKSAIQGLTRALARDLGPKNIRVNCVVPGGVFTEINQRAGLFDDETAKKRLEDMASIHALGRIGTPMEIAEAIEYLICAEWTTGAVLEVDGGLGLGLTNA